jgi:hypothetical protein
MTCSHNPPTPIDHRQRARPAVAVAAPRQRLPWCPAWHLHLLRRRSVQQFEVHCSASVCAWARRARAARRAFPPMPAPEKDDPGASLTDLSSSLSSPEKAAARLAARSTVKSSTEAPPAPCNAVCGRARGARGCSRNRVGGTRFFWNNTIDCDRVLESIETKKPSKEYIVWRFG